MAVLKVLTHVLRPHESLVKQTRVFLITKPAVDQTCSSHFEKYCPNIPNYIAYVPLPEMYYLSSTGAAGDTAGHGVLRQTRGGASEEEIPNKDL